MNIGEGRNKDGPENWKPRLPVQVPLYHNGPEQNITAGEAPAQSKVQQTVWNLFSNILE